MATAKYIKVKEKQFLKQTINKLHDNKHGT
jgi:hypothetical protein